MHVYGELTGILTPAETISGYLTPLSTLQGMLTIPSVANVSRYEGDYEVTPRLYVQRLDTSRKMMNDDVTVYEIPVTRTSNLQGGLTVLIG